MAHTKEISFSHLYSSDDLFYQLLFGDSNALQGVPLLNRVYNILSFSNLTENSVFAIQPGCNDVGNKKLAAVCIRPGIGHRQRPDLMTSWVVFQLIGEFVTRTAATRTFRTSTL